MTEVLVAVVSSLGLIVVAYMERLRREVRTANGSSLGQIVQSTQADTKALLSLMADHSEHDDRRFAEIRKRIDSDHAKHDDRRFAELHRRIDDEATS